MKESVLLRGRKLLLADDSIAIQKVVELTFGDEGMEVVSVGNGRQAVERLEEVRPDIVLADVYMPELNGYEVCEQVKRDERFRQIPVILLVGSFEPFNEAEARRVGADDYLTKPFQSIRQMVSKVGALLSGRKSEPDAATPELPAPSDASRGESHARRDDMELTTADTAPLPQQMRHEAPEDNSAPPKRPFADLQLDDEMIEETPASKYSTAGQSATGSHQRPTEPVSAQDLAEMGVKTAATSTGQSFAAGGASMLAEEAHEAAVTPAPPTAPARNADRAGANEDALLDLDDVEMPRTRAMAEADDFILDLQDAADAPQQATAPPAASVASMFESSPTVAPEDEAVVEAELTEEMTEAAPQAAEFVEAQVIGEEQQAELAPVEEPQASAGEFQSYQQSAPPVATDTTEEMQTPPDTSQMGETQELPSEPQPAPTERLPENFQPEATPVQAEAESAPAAIAPVSETPQSAPGQIGLDQLSPEVIDQIARRVVEQLSTKVIEQIAWEVVPQLSELLIKRRLEEEGKQ
jgi:CheY-like chemotaxis protein